jgi:HKD family nuclease
MLLDDAQLAGRWEELLGKAARVDIAVAWITENPSLDRLLQFAGAKKEKLRVITGVHDYLTSPVALRKLDQCGLVKIGAGDKNGMFHPKLFLFVNADGTCVCWVGSANLTGRGFGGNVELVHEYQEDGSTQTWFEQAWSRYTYPTSDWLDEYEQRCKTAGPPKGIVPQMPAPTPPGDPLESWRGYVSALKRVDKEWLARSAGKSGVFSGKNSHLGTLRAAQPLFNMDWRDLSTSEARLLLGLYDEGVDHGHLGSMQAAGTAKNVFLEATPKNVKVRREIQEEITLLLKVPLGKELPLMARKAHEVISNRDGFSGGVATRLLVLARPEVLVSVNNESVHLLAAWSNLPAASIKTAAGYEKLIKWVMNSKWWNTPAPEGGAERDLWSCRAALIDALAYDGHHFAPNAKTLVGS